MTASIRTTTPVTVVGGFLGAGKTTFLNHLLRTSRLRYAVLVNDFGAVNIDASLIAKHDGTTMSLTNGCVCCSMGGGFIDTLDRLLDSELAFDHIIIEASGVGDPWRIAEIALVEPSLRLNAIIVVADAARITHLLTDSRVGDTVRNQFARSDVVLLNKVDLVDKPARKAARNIVAALRSGVHIIETSRSTMPELPHLNHKEISGFRADAVSAEHERDFERWLYRRPGCFDRERLTQALLRLPAPLIRLKGWCRLANEPKRFLLQMVEQTWSLTPADDDAETSTSDIDLVGVGTTDLTSFIELDRILDQALKSEANATHPDQDNGGIQLPSTQFYPA